MRGSRESDWAGRAGSGLSAKVNLLIIKDEKTKDAVTYHSWQWDIAIFCCSGWNDQHLLPYVFGSLQGFPGDLARSLGKGATLTDVVQTLDKHYGMVMTFDTLSKELYSLKQGSQGECGQVQSVLVAAGSDTSVGISRKDSTRACGGDGMRSFLQGP